MALNSRKHGRLMDLRLKQQMDTYWDSRSGPAEIARVFGKLYYQYSLDGEIGGVNVASGGTKSILDTAFYTVNHRVIWDNLALRICQYWNTVVTLGDAEVLDVVVSVIPNAMVAYKPLRRAIRRHANNHGHGWVEFLEVIEREIVKIPYAVTELKTSDGTTATFTRYLS